MRYIQYAHLVYYKTYAQLNWELNLLQEGMITMSIIPETLWHLVLAVRPDTF
jgi:hypothetical protein